MAGDKEEKAVKIEVPTEDPKKKTDEEKFRDSHDPAKEKDKPGLIRKHAREEDLTEEDLKIKQDVDQCIESITKESGGVAKLAIDTLTNLLRTNTGSVASIPKPLKFCRVHYPTLVTHHGTMEKEQENAKHLADILSFVSITMPEDKVIATPPLHYKLLGNLTDLEAWGHEYVRFIAHDIGTAWRSRREDADDADTSDLQKMLDVIVPFYLAHNGEPGACDLLTECEQLSGIVKYCTNENYAKICQYLTANSYYLPHPENKETLEIAYTIYYTLKKYPEAMLVALKLNSMQRMTTLMDECEDHTLKKQMALQLARQRVILEPEPEEEDIKNLLWNTKLSEFYLYTAKDLDSLAPKSPEDVYKTHLQDQRTHLSTDISSHQLNLASTFVNAFVNAGFESDTLLTPSTEDGSEWMYKNKDHRMISAAASFGLLYLWDVDEGVMKCDKYLYSSEDYIKAGTLMALGILHCGVKSEWDSANAVMDEYLHNKSRELRLGAVIGLGFAYAGSRKEELMESLIPIVMNTDEAVEVQAFAALSLGLIYVGSCNEDVSEALITCLCEKDDKQAASPMCRFIALAAGLLFLSSEEVADAAVDACAAMHPSIHKFAEAVIRVCAYAGTGNVVQIQSLLSMISESSGKTSDDDKDKKDDKDKEEDDKGITPEMVAALGIALITIGEPLGTEMCKRMFDSVLQYGSGTSRRAVPLALAMANVSNPLMQV